MVMTDSHHQVGALKKTMDGEWCVSDGDITHLGRIMAKLPLDVRVSKLILLGYIYGCLEEAVVMGINSVNLIDYIKKIILHI